MHAVGDRKHGARCCWAFMLALVSGCASVQLHYPDGHTASMTKPEFKAYVERVFRYQNQIGDELIRADELLDDGQILADARLPRGEEAMEQACRPLIALVNAKVEHQAMKLADQLEMPRAAPACERAAQEVDALLRALPRR